MIERTHNTRCHRDHELFEPLEPRIVLATVAGVGASSDGVFASFLGQYNSINETVNLELEWNSFAFGSGSGPSNADRIVPGRDGTGSFNVVGIATDSQTGTMFLESDGYSAGWWTMSNGGYTEGDLYVELSSNSSLADLSGSWSFSHAELGPTDESATIRTGTGTISSGGRISLALGGRSYSFSLSTTGQGGMFRSSGDTTWFLNHDESVILGVDLGDDDGELGVFVGVRTDTQAMQTDVAGDYRLYSHSALQSSIDEGEALLRLSVNGTFTMYDLDRFDDGSLIQRETGSWSVSGGTVTLVESGSVADEMTLVVAENGSNLLPMSIDTGFIVSGLRSGSQIGLGTRIPGTEAQQIPAQMVIGQQSGSGRPLVHDLRENDVWVEVDLLSEATGDVPSSSGMIDLDAWINPNDHLGRVGVAHSQGTYVFTRDAYGFWTGSNLTATINGADGITSTITIFTDNNGKSYVAGVTGTGDMVAYIFDPAANNGAGAWTYTNLSAEHLTPQAESTPVFVGPIISYVTSWNGLNIAGLDADGNIQAVWSGDGGIVWHTSNLSVSTGAPPMASSLTAYLTSWGGVNIIGLDDNGQVQAAWWVPGFGSNWRVNNLTSISGGPALTGSSITSFVAPWGALNIAGLDANGDIQAYWWTPGTGAWQVANLTANIQSGDPRPVERLKSQTNTTHGGEMNIFGTDPGTSDLLRLFFRVDDGAWAIQNVSG